MSIYAFILANWKPSCFEKTYNIIWFSLFWTILVATERAGDKLKDVKNSYTQTCGPLWKGSGRSPLCVPVGLSATSCAASAPNAYLSHYLHRIISQSPPHFSPTSLGQDILKGTNHALAIFVFLAFGMVARTYQCSIIIFNSEMVKKYRGGPAPFLPRHWFHSVGRIFSQVLLGTDCPLHVHSILSARWLTFLLELGNQCWEENAFCHGLSVLIGKVVHPKW